MELLREMGLLQYSRIVISRNDHDYKYAYDYQNTN